MEVRIFRSGEAIKTGILRVALCILVGHTSLQAQSSNSQLWFEYMLNYPFGNSFNLENAFVYSTLLNTPRWRAFDYSPTLEYSLTPNIDLSLGATFSYTAQSEDFNTFEIRPVVGTRIFVTQNGRVNTRLFLRLEQRNMQNRSTREWEAVVRPRARIEGLIAINGRTLFEENLWYGILDAEWFFAVDDVNERFANRFRVRTGLGYRLSYRSRFEFIYMNQQSKNAIDDKNRSIDNILRFRYKHYLQGSRPAPVPVTGD
ncbi:MAG TPA: DUF2490 domain-containing protein [Cyclobacteriaceae bacterium]|jgi:hypothetical protein|nr:DUF2490 domain-containing protein [Cyclobacteriaceae bacterium]